MSTLKCYAGALPEYCELRVHENRSGEIRFLNGSCVANSRTAIGGASARAFRRGAWGFAASSRLSGPELDSLVSLASRNAEYVGARMTKPKSIASQPGRFDERHDFSTRKRRWSDGELVDFVKTIDARIESRYPGLKTRTVDLSHLEMRKELMTSEDGYSRSMIPRCFVTASLGLESAAGPVEHHRLFGGFGQFEDLFSDPSLLYDDLDGLYEELLRKRDAVFARPGECDVILAPELTGLLAHEAIGHTTEADLVAGGSVAGDYLERRVGSELVSLVDFANTAYGETCPQPVFVDDEGVVAIDANIIDRGVLKGFMHNRESAARYGARVTGNARAFAFSDEPLIRMRNTAFLPGRDRLEDMIASIDDGYYLVRRGSGQADSTSEFMFGVKFGYEIKGGKLGRAIRETTISGVAFDLLKTVTMAGDSMEWSVQGMCGKKQPMPTAKAGPAFRCRVHIGGR